MTRAALVVVVVVAAALVAGCENPGPEILEAAVVGDTDVERGPYEVRVVAHDDDGIGAATLSWSVAGPLTEPRTGTAPLAVVVDETLQKGTRLKGFISGQPLGSRVDWTVTVCDAVARPPDVTPPTGCTTDPGGDRVYSFRVGREPSLPQVTSATPSAGPASGATRVEIHGADLRPGAVVAFGGVDARSVEWLRTDLVAAVTDAHEVGPADITVTNPDGAAAVLADGFTFFEAPLVVAVDPGSGPESGGTHVVVRGSAFDASPGARAFFDGVPCRHQALHLSDDAADSIECDTPPGHHGAVDVEVRDDAGGVGVLAGGFEYIEAPVVVAVSPEEGTSDGGTPVTIVGDGFRDGAVVTIGGAVCTDVVVLDPTLLSCFTPAGTPGAADVVVTNDDGQSGALPGGFGFLGPPVVVEVLPGLVPVAGGVVVRVLGAGLDEGDAVTFGTLAGEVLQGSPTSGDGEIDVLVPGLPGDPPAPPSGLLAVDVTVTRNQPGDTRSGTLTAGLVYFWPPEVTAVAPPSGPTAGGTRVVVSGRFFRVIEGQPPIAVTLDGEACVDVVVLSSTSLACTVPPGDAGFADVGVANFFDDESGAAVSEGVAVGAYFYVAPPRVDAVNPAEGPTFGGDRVVIHGDFFQSGALAFIDGAPCSDVVFVSAQELTCTTPPGEEGTADVRVLNPDAQEDTAAGIYRYLGVAVTPDHGLPAGFTRVSVRSAGMSPDAVIFFGNNVADCSFVSAREFICQTPRSSLAANGHGDVDVRFANPDGTGEAGVRAFHYRAYAAHSDDLPTDGLSYNDVDLADFDGDRDLDVVVATGRVGIAEQSAVYENDGAGHFTKHDLDDVFASANNASVGDGNGDGRPDVLFGCTSNIGPILVENRGGFDFRAVNLGLDSVGSDAFDAEFIDVDGDGRDDVYNLSIGCSPFDPNFPNCDPAVIGPDDLLEQTSDGFHDVSDLVPHDPDWVHDHKLVALDVDGDGDQDVVIVTNNIGGLASEQNRLMRNRLDEGLGFVAEFPPDLLNTFGDLYDLDAGDIDGDGDDDLVTTLCEGDVGEVLLKNDNGTLVSDDAALPSLSQTCTVGSALVDLDDDGDLDLLFGGTRALSPDFFDVDPRVHMRVLVNKGDGTFVDASGALPSFGNEHLQLNNFAVGDIDGDHDPDILIAGGAPYAESFDDGRVVVLHME